MKAPRAAATRTTVYQTPCPPQAAEWLGIQAGTEVVVRDRVMGVQGQPPDQLDTSYLPLAVAERVPQVRDLLDLPPGWIYRRLDLPPGTPVLILDGADTQEGEALQYIAKVIAGDRLETAYLYGTQQPPVD